MSTSTASTVPNIRIRPEQVEDIATIADITRAAFHDHPHSSGNEHRIVDSLRRNGFLALSLVAEVEGKVVGHVAFSSVEVSDGSGGWFGLGPLAVVEGMRGRGIGSALVREGLQQLRDRAAAGCVVFGSPGFYHRFGFAHDPSLMMEEAPQEFFLALPFISKRATGLVTYHRIFYTSY